MKLPKIIFRNSSLYDYALARPKSFKIPSKEFLLKFQRKIEKVWEKDGEKILLEISKVTNLKWNEKEIVCYMTAGIYPYSDPLTINPKSDVHTLTHELIHRILSEPENWKIIKRNFEKLVNKFEGESYVMKMHVVVHAIHGIILRKLYNEMILEKEKKTVTMRDYVVSWEVADKLGYENIVKELRK